MMVIPSDIASVFAQEIEEERLLLLRSDDRSKSFLDLVVPQVLYVSAI